MTPKFQHPLSLALALSCAAQSGLAHAAPPAARSAEAAAVAATQQTLTLSGAQLAIAAIAAKAKALGVTATVAVVDGGGNLIALARGDGAFAAGAKVSFGKARTAALFRKPTTFFEDTIRKGRTPMIALDDFTPLQGGVPILVRGELLGAIGVSGASSAAQDEEFAIAGANALLSALGAEAITSNTAAPAH